MHKTSSFFSIPFKKAAMVAVATVSLGAATLTTIEPAQAFRGGGVGFRHFGGFGHGGFGRGGFGRFGYGGGWGGRRFGYGGGWGGRRFGYGGWGGYRRFGYGGWGYRRFGWGYPAIGFGVGYGLAAASYGYGYPYGGYGGGYGDAGYQNAGYPEDGAVDGRSYRRHGACNPYGTQTHLQKRYCP